MHTNTLLTILEMTEYVYHASVFLFGDENFIEPKQEPVDIFPVD